MYKSSGHSIHALQMQRGLHRHAGARSPTQSSWLKKHGVTIQVDLRKYMDLTRQLVPQPVVPAESSTPRDRCVGAAKAVDDELEVRGARHQNLPEYGVMVVPTIQKWQENSSISRWCTIQK